MFPLRLPLNLTSLDTSQKASAMGNLLEQLGAQYKALRSTTRLDPLMPTVKSKVLTSFNREGPSQGLMPEIFHKEFSGLAHMDLEERLEEIQSREVEGLLERKVMVQEREELVDLLLDGIQYYQRYQADMLTWLIQVI